MSLSDYFAEGALGRRQQYELTRAEMKNDRASFDAHYRDLGENLAPRRVRFSTSDVNKGDKRNQKIIDSTPLFATRTLRAGMTTSITSPARPWFGLTTPDPDLAEFGPVKTYLDDVRDRMLARFLRSNLYQALPTLYGDMGVFGTGTMAILEDDESTFRCTPFAIGEYYIANDDKGRVRVFMREFRMTVRQLLLKFGRKDGAGRIVDWSNFSPAVKSAYEKRQLGTMIDVVHAVQPNDDYNPRYLESRYKKFTDCYYELGAQSGTAGNPVMLQEKGFDEFPILVGRWDLTAGDVYATECPGMISLGDVKMLQHGEKSSAQILDKINKPPMVAPTSMKSTPLTLLPGGVSYGDETTEKKFRPAIDVSHFRFDLAEGKQQAIRSRIERAFYADLFLLMSQAADRDYTATEIIERKEEKLLALGPMVENTNQDVLDPLIDRSFNIMNRRGELPPPPKELEDQELRVDYISMMAQAQKAVGRSGMQGFISFAAEIATAKQDPSVWDKVDTDQAIDEAATMFGVPSRLVIPDEQVAATRQSRAQQQQAAQQAATLKDAAQGAKTLSETDTQGNNALTDILTNAGARPAGATP